MTTKNFDTKKGDTVTFKKNKTGFLSGEIIETKYDNADSYKSMKCHYIVCTDISNTNVYYAIYEKDIIKNKKSKI